MAVSDSPRFGRRRLALAIVLSLLPWPAVWLGMYRLHDLFWTFVLYHGVCLLPASLIGRRLWISTLRRPAPRELAILLATAVIVLPASVWVYQKIGELFMNPANVEAVVTASGFRTRMLWPLAIYFIPVNAILEETFWRGVILNELRGLDKTSWMEGAVWATAAFGTWHYLVVRLLLKPGWAELAVMGIIASGVFFTWLYRGSRSLVLTILWHALVFDTPLLLIFAAVLRG